MPPAKKTAPPHQVHDMVWVLAQITRVGTDDAGSLKEITVEMANGNKETLRYEAGKVKAAE